MDKRWKLKCIVVNGVVPLTYFAEYICFLCGKKKNHPYQTTPFKREFAYDIFSYIFFCSAFLAENDPVALKMDRRFASIVKFDFSFDLTEPYKVISHCTTPHVNGTRDNTRNK